MSSISTSLLAGHCSLAYAWRGSQEGLAGQGEQERAGREVRERWVRQGLPGKGILVVCTGIVMLARQMLDWIGLCVCKN